VEKAFASDCEGPISKNDNAFEIASHFIPKGDRLFTVLSRYDDVLASVLKRSGYKAGSTLKLIVPFLKAHDVTDQKMRKFSAQSLTFIANVKDTLRYVQGLAFSFIVSTSYEHFIEALCNALDFPYANTYCTRVSIDEYSITEEEKKKLKEFTREISQMPEIQIPLDAKSISALREEHQKAIERLDEILWEEIADTSLGRIYREVDPVGGKEKACAVKDAVRRVGIDVSNVVYVGDSITDVEAFEYVRESGGLAVSFNGNRYAIESAEIAVLSENSIASAIITDVFCRLGKQEVLRLAEDWTTETLKRSVNQTLLGRLFEIYPSELPKVQRITSENVRFLAKESSEFRKKVRGEAIGRLG